MKTKLWDSFSEQPQTRQEAWLKHFFCWFLVHFSSNLFQFLISVQLRWIVKLFSIAFLVLKRCRIGFAGCRIDFVEFSCLSAVWNLFFSQHILDESVFSWARLVSKQQRTETVSFLFDERSKNGKESSRLVPKLIFLRFLFPFFRFWQRNALISGWGAFLFSFLFKLTRKPVARMVSSRFLSFFSWIWERSFRSVSRRQESNSWGSCLLSFLHFSFSQSIQSQSKVKQPPIPRMKWFQTRKQSRKWLKLK